MTLDPLQVALWRFEQITPVLELCLSRTQRSNLIDAMAKRSVSWPSGDTRPIARSTIYYWYRKYLRAPQIESLLPALRSPSTHKQSSIKSEWVAYALALLEEEPNRSLYVLCQRIQMKFGLQAAPARSTLHRFLRRQSRYVKVRTGDASARRTRFVAAAVHQIWHGDAKADFVVRFFDGSSRRIRILSLLDDCSRFILAARVVASESLPATVATFTHAVRRFGLPLCFYADRGSPYDSYLFRQGLAILGVRRINTRPRNPSAHGKIEAYHRSLHRWFIRELAHQPVRDIDHLQLLLDAVIERLYHQHIHRELKATPTAAFNNTISERTVSHSRLHEAFLQRHTLTPEKKTGNVRLCGTLFRVPSHYLVPRKALRFAIDITDPSIAYLVEHSGSHVRLEPAMRKAGEKKLLPNPPEFLPQGSLSPLLETYRGRTLPRPCAGFGLPEIYQRLAEALGRTVPDTEREASLVLLWLKNHGPFEPRTFSHAVDAAVKHIGNGRPLAQLLDELSRIINRTNTTKEDPQ
jgi:transposase InsO family protein